MSWFSVSKFFLITAVLAVAVVTTSTLFPFIVGKYAWFRTSVDLALVAFLLGLLFQDQSLVVSRKLLAAFREPLTIAVTVFVAIFLLACLFGVDPAMSFWSNFERGEGGFQLIHLWLFFILLVTLFRAREDWGRILGWVLVGGVLMAIYGLLAGLGVEGFVGGTFGPGFRFNGSIGNPSYVAAYSLFMLFYVAYLYVERYRRRPLALGAFVLYALTLVFLATFFSSATRGAFVGLIASALVFFGYFIWTHRAWRKWFLAAAVLLVILVGVLVTFRDTPFVKNLPASRIFDLSFSAETFRHRAIMWGIAWEGFLERPLLGWGPENYLEVFDRRFDTAYYVPAVGFGAWFDRAHSVYFDYLVETGALGLLSYLSIFVLYYVGFFRAHRAPPPAPSGGKRGAPPSPPPSPLVHALLLALPVGYLVQGLVLFDVLPIYLNVFLMLALATFWFREWRGGCE